MRVRQKRGARRRIASIHHASVFWHCAHNLILVDLSREQTIKNETVVESILFTFERSAYSTIPCMTGSLAHSLHGLEIPLLPRAAVNRAYRLALATKLGGTALARLWPRFAQCSRNMPSMARSSAGLISRECATVTE
jgi:hypothetical protein